jgi:hypothetical protein
VSLSLFKLVGFLLGSAVALLGLSDLRYSVTYWTKWFLTVYVVFLVLSVPLLFLPQGHHLSAAAFQGIFWHPQSYGVYVISFTVYLTAAAIVGHHIRPWALALPVVAWYCVFASGCRTAVVAAGMASIIVGLCAMTVRWDFLGLIARRGVVLKVCIGGIVMLIIAALSAPSVASSLGGFFGKGTNTPIGSVLSLDWLLSPVGIAGASRSSQITEQVQSIVEHPWTGVGFGLGATVADQQVERNETLGIPIGAPVEQGFLPLAVLTQVGILGALPLVLFLLTLATPIVKYAEAPIAMLFWTTLCMNFGEMVFFGSGGLGMQMWLLLALCYRQSLDQKGSVGAICYANRDRGRGFFASRQSMAFSKVHQVKCLSSFR